MLSSVTGYEQPDVKLTQTNSSACDRDYLLKPMIHTLSTMICNIPFSFRALSCHNRVEENYTRDLV